nr:putative reverse transcriptase domain-containing protein [Tanacetum cinerariifolium]
MTDLLAKVGKVAYKLELPQELSRIHHTFHVSNLKKCYSDEPLVMSLEGVYIDDMLQFMEEPVEIMEQEIKRLKRSRIPLVKDEKDPKEDPTDYPADRGNNDDDKSSNDDDNDDNVEKDEEDKEEEEYLALADPSDVSTDDLVPSS